MPDKFLKQVADELLERMPEGALPARIAESLHAPTVKVLREAGAMLIERGQIDLAENLYRALVGQRDVGPWAALGLTQIASKKGDDVATVAAWRECLRQYPDDAKPVWFQALARALRKNGEDQAAERAIGDLIKRFPNDPVALVHQAKIAAGLQDWSRALDLWTKCLEHHAEALTKPEWHNGRARALFRLWRTEEALNVWRDLIDRFPDFVPARREMAGASQELGDWSMAQQIWTDLILRFPTDVMPEWLERRAFCLVELLDDASGPAIAELERRFPDSAIGRRLSIDFAYKMNLGSNAISEIIEDAIRRFPADRQLLVHYTRLLLATGRYAEAEKAVEQLEATEDDHLALISRWRLIMDRDGDAAIRDLTRTSVSDRKWALSPGLAICEFLLSIWTLWAAKLAVVLCNDLMERFPSQVAVISTKARALIMLRQYTHAMKLIDAIPASYRRPEVLELKAWAAAHRGEHESARQIWQTILASRYFSAIHSAEPKLELMTPERKMPEPEGVTVIVPVHDELANLPDFLRHYRQLGVRRFIVVDNMSTDGTEDYLREQPDVILYRTEDNFEAANSGMRWINALIEKHGAGGWCLFADADEQFIYPGWETMPLALLTEYLDRGGAEGMAAFMLDVYPESLTDAAGQLPTHADCQYYDDNYVWVGHSRPPYSRPLGGVRTRLFKAQEYLHKIPLIKCGRGTYIGNHETTHLRMARVTGAFRHYKMLRLASEIGQLHSSESGNPFVADLGLEVMRRYERYALRLAALKDADLRLPGVSRLLTDSVTLADRGLMQAPPEYRRWLDETRNSADISAQ